MMSSTDTMPAVRPYSSTTTASGARSRWRSASRSSSGLVSGTIIASLTLGSIEASGPSFSSRRLSEFTCTIPRMRSVFWFSVTSRRVWPESMQRRSAASTVSETSTVTTAGIGVITWRASCSCRWKTPESITASPGSSLPLPWLRAISSLRSSELVTSSNSALASTPSVAQHRVRGGVERPDERLEHDPEELQAARR